MLATETITWRAVADGLPDAELTVLIHNRAHQEPVWLGWFDGAGQWFDTEATPVVVTHWADMPEGPKA